MAYSYILRKFRDFSVVGELALSDVSFGFALNGYGTMSATVGMDDPLGDPFLWTTPKRFVLCIEQDGFLAWSGPIWTRTKDFGSRTIQIAGNEWGSIFSRFFVGGGDQAFDSFTVHDVLELMTNFINTFVPIPVPVWGYIPLPTGTRLNNLITTVFAESEHILINDVIDQLANSDSNGFEYRWHSRYDGAGMLVWEGQAGAPLGRPYNGAGQAVYEAYAPGGNGRSGPAPSGNPSSGATVLKYTVDEADSPSFLQGFNANGDLVGFAQHTYAGSPDDPVVTTAAYTFPDLDDNAITDLINSRLNVTSPNGDVPGHYVADLYVPRPIPAGYDNGAPGDWVRFDYQERAGDAVKSKQLRILSLTVTVNNDGTEAIQVTLSDGASAY